MILAHSIYIHTIIVLEICPAVAEIWALPVYAARLGAMHLDRMHQQPDLGLPLSPRMLHTNFGPNRSRIVDLYSRTKR